MNTITAKNTKERFKFSMKEISKRLVEVEYILKKLDSEHIKKIPTEIWDYISENKDNNYNFNYDESKPLAEQNLNVDTIAFLTYINMEYLLDKEQKQAMKKLLTKDEMIAEEKKKVKYNADDLFKNRKPNNNENKTEKIQMVEYKEQTTLRKIINKILTFIHQ